MDLMVKWVVKMKAQISLIKHKCNFLSNYAGGFTYIGLLIIIAIMGINLALAGTIWSFTQQREQERQLIFVGNQYLQAIGNYYQRTPGSVKTYPATLQNLLQDNRYVSTQRHLRKLYADPITQSQDWGIVTAPQGGIMGVYSKSKLQPIKNAGFKQINANFEGQKKYSDWQFIYSSPTELIKNIQP
jgi:type II secretory pathway pseudopilin PulG